MEEKKKRSADADAMEKDRDRLEDLVVQQLKFYDKVRSLGDGYQGANPQELGLAVAREAPGVISDMVRSSLEMQSNMLKRSERHFERISESLFGDKAKSAAGSTVRLSMEARPGKPCEAPFRLKNPRGENMEISFTIPALKGDGGVGYAGVIGFLRKEDGRDAADFCLPARKKNDKESGGARFSAVVTLPPDAKPGCYEGTAHVVTDSIVLGHVEFVVNVKSVETDRIEAAADSTEAKSAESWKTTNSYPETRSLSVPSPLRLRGDDAGSELVVQMRLVNVTDATTVFEIAAGSSANTCLAISPLNGHAWTPGVYRASVPVFFGAEVASERLLVVTIKAAGT